jgi:hypothetical protein
MGLNMKSKNVSSAYRWADDRAACRNKHKQNKKRKAKKGKQRAEAENQYT